MIYVCTRAGKRHSANEDAVLAGDAVVNDGTHRFELPECGFICVADGVGGHAGGANAARYVLGELAKAGAVEADALCGLLTGINDELIETSAKKPLLARMAATLTGLYVDGEKFYLIHVGNTRLYIRQGRYLKQMTPDHTTYNWLKSSGQTELAERCNRSEITNCFGGGDRALLSRLYVAPLSKFSLAVLTSDGVHEYVDEDRMEDILSGDKPYLEKCESIIQSALEAGSEDDLTVVIISTEH